MKITASVPVVAKPYKDQIIYHNLITKKCSAQTLYIIYNNRCQVSTNTVYMTYVVSRRLMNTSWHVETLL